MNLRPLLGLLGLVFTFFACQKNDPPPAPEPEVFKVETLIGYVQKGPFSIGSTLTVSELNANFSQTGKSFNSSIQDNSGKFELKSLVLASSYVDIRASGFYFDEIEGVLSAAPLQLSAIADLTKAATLNVNVLAHLEEGRVRTLLSQKVAFAEAKRRAQQEVLTMFEIKPGSQTAPSELLDIAAGGTDNAALLAVSVILQASRNVGELSELLAALKADIQSDGVLNDASLGSKLVNGVKFLNLANVRKNLERRYADLKLPATIPPFEPLIEQFLKTTKFPYTFRYTYPKDGQYGPNVLAMADKALVRTDRSYSFTVASLRDAPVKIRITLLNDTTGSLSNNGLGFPVGFNSGWTFKTISAGVREITVAPKTDLADMRVDFFGVNSCSIAFFENNAPQPVEVKQISWGVPDPNIDPIYPAKSDAGITNIFSLPYSNAIAKGKYSLVVDLPKEQEREFKTTLLIASGTVEVDKSLPADWTVTPSGSNLILSVKGKNKRAQITLNLVNSGYMNVVTAIDGKAVSSLDKKISW